MRTTFLALLFCSLAWASPSDAHFAGHTKSAAYQQYSLETIRSECIDFAEVKRSDLRECKVSEFGEIGKVGKQTYYYAIYCLVPVGTVQAGGCTGDSFNAHYFRARGLAIFVRDPSSGEKFRLHIERVGAEIGIFVYSEKPQLIQNPSGTILRVPVRVDGTGNGNASEYYLWDGKEWQPIESEAWCADLRSRIPSDRGIWKGVWPDLRSMRAEAALYRKGDANCCPTGGMARVGLSLKDRRFVMTSLVIEAEQ